MPDDKPAKKTSVANDESKRWRGGMGSQQKVDERVNATYGYILEGGTRRSIADKVSSRFNVSVRTAHEDYRKAMELLKEEQIATRSELLNHIQALRLTVVRRAIQKNQLMTAASLLKDMGAVIGEAETETSIQDVKLNIKIEPSAD